MKVLLVGNSQSIFIKELANQLILKKGHIVHILDLYNGLLANYQEFANIAPKENKKKSRLKTNLLFFVNINRLAKEIRKNKLIYDVCNIHLIDARYYFILKKLKKFSKRLVASVYGSDFYRFKKYSFLSESIYREADKITFSNERVKNDFLEFYGAKYENKTVICRFGLSNIEAIRFLLDQMSKQEIRRKYDYPLNKTIIAVGYASGPIHRHEPVIEVLRRLPQKIKDTCLFLFPMTYGGNQKQISLVKSLVNLHKLNARVLEDFMITEQIAALRISTDILIHVPPSDQLSGTMLEVLYAGNTVVVGDWLKYPILDKSGIIMPRAKHIDELPKVLTEIIEGENQMNSKANQDTIFQIASWDANIELWNNVYAA